MPQPDPPKSIPKYIREGLEKQGPETLRTIADFAERMADYKVRQIEQELEEQAVQDAGETPEEWDEEAWTKHVDDIREEKDIPSKATLTTKRIDGRDYYYYQWREGDKITSEYVAPVNPAS